MGSDKIFPTLYKQNTSRNMMVWDIKVYPNPALPGAYDIETRFGQEGGKIQETSDTIFEGKNLGKKNETTVFQQAVNEAESKWKAQFDKGYVAERDRAERGESDLKVSPMLAQDYEKHGKKIKFPCAGQPKLDGIRCIAVVDNGECKLYSRKGKPINSVPHICRYLLELCGEESVIFDGELYNHDYKEDFEKIVSAVRKDNPSPESEKVRYYIYDIVDESKTQEERLKYISSLLSSNYVQPVTSILLSTSEDADTLLEAFLDQGYEGLMLRNLAAPYEKKRSYNLQKYKVFLEEEFPIIDFEEGRGKLQGHVAAFVCETPEGKKFKAKLDGSLGYLKECFEDHSLWKSKILTVKFQGYTNKECVPRFPVGKAIRDYE